MGAGAAPTPGSSPRSLITHEQGGSRAGTQPRPPPIRTLGGGVGIALLGAGLLVGLGGGQVGGF